MDLEENNNHEWIVISYFAGECSASINILLFSHKFYISQTFKQLITNDHDPITCNEDL